MGGRRGLAPQPNGMSADVPHAPFREAMRRFPSGVTIVTTVDGAGRRWGFTASAFAFVSREPPQVLVCLDCSANCHPTFSVAERFAVNILGAEHAELARRFATKGIDKFGPDAFELGELRLPVLRDALVVLECHTAARLSGGDHTILLGEAVSTRLQAGAPAVVYDRRFWKLTEASSTRPQTMSHPSVRGATDHRGALDGEADAMTAGAGEWR
jgi:flavin reductase ActVB